MKPLTAFGAIALAALCTIAPPGLADTLRTGNLMKCVDSAVNGPPRWDLGIMGHRFTCHKIRVATEAEAKRARTYNPNNAFYKGKLIHALHLRPDDDVYYTITLENWATDCKILMPDMQIDRGALSRIGMKVPAFLRPGYALTKDLERRLRGSWEATAEMVVMASVDKWADSQPQCKRAWLMAADAVPLAPVAPATQPTSAVNAEIRTGAGLCLDVHTPEMRTNGGRVQVWACHGGPQQRWTYDPASHALRNSGGLCLDVTAGQMATNGTRVQVWACNGEPQQQWTPLAGGALRNAGGLCLDVHAPDQATNGARVQIWQCHGAQQQRFLLGPGTGAPAVSAQDPNPIAPPPVTPPPVAPPPVAPIQLNDVRQWRVENSDTVLGNEPYELHNMRRRALNLTSQLGVERGHFLWAGSSGGHFIFVRTNTRDGRPISADEVVGLYNTKNEKYFKGGWADSGAGSLGPAAGWSDTPVYLWMVKHRVGADFALYNFSRRDYLVLAGASNGPPLCYPNSQPFKCK